MKFTNEEKDIMIIMIQHELDFYEQKEDMYEEDYEYVEQLKSILDKIKGGER